MLLIRLNKLLGRLFFYIKLIIYKLMYGGSLNIQRPLKTYIGALFKISINQGGSIEIGKDFHSRRYLNLNANSGVIKIGDNVFFNNFVSINSQSTIDIGNNTLIGENVKIYDHNHCFNRVDLIRKQGFSNDEVHIGSNVWICSNVIILKGVKIGDNSVISAGCIVKNNIPNDSLVFKDRVVKITRG